ncbi:v-type atpase 116kda subunit family protein [Stylonychia lemnae]|uniref:V-type proton ATPase subunit a n=1 Tax=Stylonychia lemnae TaxID=5949 RepID=A0A078B352_STYLE|nr:v-type atpase 116kda subunit family protein [Stylonychia lemnae]|eukprot:CDW87677.1 v-type atpase 116kda subunit family protein [Stylonychia lemnae]
MGILRSEDMFLFKFVVQKDNVWEIINNLGRTKSVHFIDMNRNEQSFKLPYTDMIKRCEETERRLIYRVKLITPQTLQHLEQSIDSIGENKRKAMSVLFEDIENEIREKEQFVISQNEKIKSMIDILNMQIEYQTVLEKADKIIHGKIRSRGSSLQGIQNNDFEANASQPFGRSKINYSNEEVKEEEIQLSGRSSGGSNRLEQSFREVSIRYVAGTIENTEVERFKKVLFRSLRGKVLSYFDESNVILNDFQGKSIRKCVYVLVFEEGSHFIDKVTRICEAFSAKRYSLPEGGHTDKSAFHRKIQKIAKNITDTQQMLKFTRQQMHNYLEGINQTQGVAFSVQEVYKLFIKKEKSVYLVLNQLKTERNLCFGFFWSNLAKHQLMNTIYKSGHEDMNLQQKIQIEDFNFSKIKPPTYIQTNEFTYIFQEIINTYGVPTYKEINPAIFACVSFPFLFGVMFGDVGHGSLLLFIGTVLCLFNNCIGGNFPAMKPVLQLRYVVFLMGLFGMFAGFIYNDMMSISLNVYGSCYNTDTGKYLGNDCIYPIGLDPIWSLSKNELSFQNSLKMKISVILGVMQMSLGVVLKAFNAVFFKNSLDFYHEFIPQILLLWSLFGYMDSLIVIKWLTNYQGDEHSAPSIITTMINLALNGGHVEGRPFIGSYGANKAIMIALICVPWMLFVKPLKLRKEHEHKDQEEQNNHYQDQRKNQSPQKKINQNSNNHFSNLASDQMTIADYGNNEDIILDLMGQGGHQNHEFSEIFIHQLIETIEFVLGTISNTASYLRLWALSLAHSQLSKVFFEHSLLQGIIDASPVKIFVCYFIWATATFGVLMCMDVLECFLHTLRLHWVEFQNKFYKGQGYKFQPFTYDILFK